MRLSRLLAIAAFVALGAVPAQAQVDTLFDGTYTGGNEFNTTASITLAYSDLTGGVYEFYVDVVNLGCPLDAACGVVYNAIGLFNLPTDFVIDPTLSSALFADNTNDGWHLPPPNDLNGAGLTKETTAFEAPSDGSGKPFNSLAYGSLGTFSFHLSNLASDWDPASVGVGIHGISGPSGCSTKFGVKLNDSGVAEAVGQAPEPNDCTNVVPEPATIVLLATGFLGLLGFAYVRHTV